MTTGVSGTTQAAGSVSLAAKGSAEKFLAVVNTMQNGLPVEKWDGALAAANPNHDSRLTETDKCRAMIALGDTLLPYLERNLKEKVEQQNKNEPFNQIFDFYLELDKQDNIKTICSVFERIKLKDLMRKGFWIYDGMPMNGDFDHGGTVLRTRPYDPIVKQVALVVLETKGHLASNETVRLLGEYHESFNHGVSRDVLALAYKLQSAETKLLMQVAIAVRFNFYQKSGESKGQRDLATAHKYISDNPTDLKVKEVVGLLHQHLKG